MMIKVFLIASVLAATAYLVRSGATGRRLAIRRIVSLVFATCWTLAVIAPDDIVTRVANLVGVGRGTDLVLYLLVVAFLFSTVSTRQSIHDLEDRLAQLTRELALRQVKTPPSTGPPTEAPTSATRPADETDRSV